MNDICEACKVEEARREDGICPYSHFQSNDVLPARCVGAWSEDKLYYLGRYMNIFNMAMKNKWPKRAFLDLFAGPGKCIIRGSARVISGSTLLALEQDTPFSLIVSVDINSNAISALEERAREYKSHTNLKTFVGDCNSLVDLIRTELDPSYLTLAFIDPTSMQMKFSTIRALTEGLRMDLIINYPLHAINRAYKDALSGNGSTFNEFFGTSDWERTVLGLKNAHNVAAKLLPLYKQQLRQIGYKHIADLSIYTSFKSDEVLVKGPRNIPLYYLFLCSKNSLGNRLWQEIKKIGPHNQGQLF